MVSYTTDEMLAQWKLRRHLLPLRCDAGVVSDYGVDFDALCRNEMRQWYLDLLATAPVGLLEVSDLSGQVMLRCDDDGVGVVVLPDNVVRLTAVDCDVWKHPAIIVTDPESPLALLQRSYYSRGGEFSPVAVLHGRELRLYSFNDIIPQRLNFLGCVCVPNDGRYVFDERAWGAEYFKFCNSER